jgi:hypothetical protein
MQLRQPATERAMQLQAIRAVDLGPGGAQVLADHSGLQRPRHPAGQDAVAEQPRHRQPAPFQEPQCGHLARLLGLAVLQVDLEDRLLAHGEHLVAVLLLQQSGWDRTGKHLPGERLHVVRGQPQVALHPRHRPDNTPNPSTHSFPQL